MNRRRALTALVGALAPTVAKITPAFAKDGIVRSTSVLSGAFGQVETFIGGHTTSKLVTGTVNAEHPISRFSDANWPGNRTYTLEEYFAIKDWERYFGPWTG